MSLGILEILNTVNPPEEFSKPVADFISKAFIAIPQQVIKKIDSLKRQYKVPRNCKILEVPKVNQELQSQLPVTVKSSDLKLIFVQQPISKALLALLKIVENCTSKRSTNSEIIKKASMQHRCWR